MEPYGLIAFLTVAVLVVAAWSTGSSKKSQKPYEGVTVNIVTFTGPRSPSRCSDARRLREAHRRQDERDHRALLRPLQQAADRRGTNSYDAYVFAPQWMGDFIEPGYLEDLTDRVKADTSLKWDDIAPFFRDFSATYKGKVYTIPLDGDFQMVYYRTDLLKQASMQPPKTWDDYLAIAKRLQRQGPERRRQAGLRLLHRQEAQRPGLLDHPLGRRRLPADPGHQPGRLLRHRTHDAAHQQRGLRKALKIYMRHDQVWPAGRDQPRCRRHARPVHHRPLRSDARLGRYRHARHRPQDHRRSRTRSAP